VGIILAQGSKAGNSGLIDQLKEIDLIPKVAKPLLHTIELSYIKRTNFVNMLIEAQT
jgi:hypothetical protein